MKQFILAGAIVLTASTAFAGNIQEPTIEPEITPIVIEEQTPSGGDAWIVPFLAGLFFGFVVIN